MNEEKVEMMKTWLRYHQGDKKVQDALNFTQVEADIDYSEDEKQFSLTRHDIAYFTEDELVKLYNTVEKD